MDGEEIMVTIVLSLIVYILNLHHGLVIGVLCPVIAKMDVHPKGVHIQGLV